MTEKKVVLKPGREKALLNRHPWIFSGAVESFPLFQNGETLPVHSSQGAFLAKAYFHKDNSISGRVLTFSDEPIETALLHKLRKALEFRETLFDREKTNCYRLVNAEADGLPGLVIDLYDDIAVLQVNTQGMERVKPLLITLLQQLLPLRGIYEKSHSSARRHENLPDFVGPVFGECPKEILVKENGLCFLIDLEGGQKTGFFLDQREMRQLVSKMSKGKNVLNCFSYTAAFSLFALKGGAASVTSVDSSESACRYARENTLLNHFPLEKHEVIQGDVFKYLHAMQSSYDFIILDPPAFAKTKQQVNDACRGYKEINRRALEKMAPNSYLLTSSCSHFIDETLFGQLLFQAALEAKREVVICSRHIQAIDHPISLFHPEGSYLKSLLLYIS
jgi:23S rRNA (cytosine1962-C5)-methyltransferase